MTSVQKPRRRQEASQSLGRRSSYLAGQGRERGAGLGPESASWGRRHGSPGSWAKSQIWAGSQKAQDKCQNNRTERNHCGFAGMLCPALCCDLWSRFIFPSVVRCLPLTTLLIFRKVSEACPWPSATQPQADATSLGLSFLPFPYPTSAIRSERSLGRKAGSRKSRQVSSPT